MEKLPVETVSHICSFLSHRRDIQAFRLVCKSLAAIGAEYVRQSFFMHMTEHHLNQLFDLSSETQLARGIEYICYAPITLSTPGATANEYQHIRDSNHYSDNNLEPLGGYTRYTSLRVEQANIMRTNRDFDLFLTAFQQFPRLRHIKLFSYYSTLAQGGPLVQRARYGELTQFNYAINLTSAIASVRHLNILLEVIALARVKLETLELDQIDWRFFDRDVTELQKVLEPIAKLKCFNISISNLYTHLIQPFAPMAELTRCRRLMDSGVLQKCLSIFTEARCLSLVFNHWCLPMHKWDPAFGAPPQSASLSQIVPKNFTWTHLTMLRLCHIDAERQELMAVLLRHKGTLQVLYLQSIYLRSSSWIPLLDSIRKELYLTEACIGGVLSGHFEDEENDGELQYWRLYPGYQESLLGLVNAYVLKDGEDPAPKTCPLTYENSLKRVG
ncbi:hypothetical protein F4819DRAFT_510477 [Hypoxylon fuscum]|nr:hypothetical protein F4819DRAFT_510477 [Hypoxylon fuscum]